MLYFHQNASRKTTLLGVMFHICIIFYPSYGSIYYIFKSYPAYGLLHLTENIAVAATFLYTAFLHITVYYFLQDTLMSYHKRLEELYQSYNPFLPLYISRLWITGILASFVASNAVVTFAYYAMFKKYAIVADFVLYCALFLISQFKIFNFR